MILASTAANVLRSCFCPTVEVTGEPLAPADDEERSSTVGTLTRIGSRPFTGNAAATVCGPATSAKRFASGGLPAAVSAARFFPLAASAGGGETTLCSAVGVSAAGAAAGIGGAGDVGGTCTCRSSRGTAATGGDSVES